MRIWKEVSVQVFEFFFVLACFITSEIFKSPLHFLLPRNSSHACCVTAASFKTRPCFLWPQLSSNLLSVRFVIIQFFRSPHHFVSTELSLQSLLFCYRGIVAVTALFCYHNIVEFISPLLCLLAQRYYSSGVFVLLLQHCRSHLSVAWPQHSWGLQSVYVRAACLVSPPFVFFTQHYSSHPSVSIVTEEFFQVTCLAI